MNKLKNGLTLRQNLFVKNLSKGKNQTESAILAGYSSKSADVIGSQMMRNVKIIKALEDVGLSDKILVNNIKENMEAGAGVKATADTSLRATELALRLKGYLDKEQEQPTNTTNIYVQELRVMDSTALHNKLDAILSEVEQLQ